jgi:glycerol kinase
MSGKRYVLALDQGTTSSRSVIFDEAGCVVALAQQEFAQYFPQSGWVEHNALEIWESQLNTAREALANARLTAADIAAIGITNQRETTVLWDRKTGQPLANAIVWQDRRTASVCDALRAQGHSELIARKTGLVIDAYFSGTKTAWLLDHIPGARARAEAGELAMGTIDSWLIFNLTGGRLHITDVSNASRTMLLNIHTLEWDTELLALLRVPPSVLPRVVGSSMVVGQTDAQIFGSAITIAGIAGDQQAATFGQACFSPGMAKNTYGTGCFMLLNTGTQPVTSRNRLLTTVGWQLRNPTRGNETAYCLEGSVFIGGAVVQWLRDGLGVIEHSEDVQTLAASVPDSGGVMLVPAFAGLGAPHWDAYARGAIVGISRGTTRAHIARAAVESIAYQSTELLEAMVKDTNQAVSQLRVDGGASRNDALMQFQADLLGIAVIRPAVTETTALGAAFLAGLAVGVWESVDAVAALTRKEGALQRIFESKISAETRTKLMARWRRAVDRSRDWAGDD